MNQQPSLTCAVCGENDFHLKEGFYYCNECGTKSEQVRAIEIETEDNFEGAQTFQTKIKLKTDKTSGKLALTSWECYNYILRGMVEEIIELGAKDELKTVVFQLWAAFLRNREVAFFSRRQSVLPKLGIKYEKNDAAILYNHAKERKKLRRERKDNASSKASSSRREWRKQMKNYDQSQYESSMLSQSLIISQSSFTDTSLNSSSSAPSNRAIQLKFSSYARKQLKKKMPLAHLKKHENDFDGTLQCHDLTIKQSELGYNERNKTLNIKLMYAFLAVGLNLIEDDIQLTDLLRFISDGHISTYNLERFFPPENIEACKESLKSYRLNFKAMEFSASQLRLHCAEVGKVIHLNYFKIPNMIKLVQRYTTELCLPDEINIFIERLITLHPPKMEWAGKLTHSPPYESRAMAYIIFTLKLLFGIDGRKEKVISRSARKINSQLDAMNLPNEKLFIWDDWVEFIELRKVFLCKHNTSICKQFKQVIPREVYLKNLEEHSYNFAEDLSQDMVKRQRNMGSIFHKYLHLSGENADYKDVNTIQFTPSFTPCQNNLKRLQLDPTISATIPDILEIDHTKRSLLPLVRATKLKEIFSQHDKKLKVVRIPCTSKRNVVGVFKNYSLLNASKNPKKIIFSNDSKPWESRVESDKPPDSIFSMSLDTYSEKTHSKKRIEEKKKKTNIAFDFGIKHEESFVNDNLRFFTEDNMDPAEIALNYPRRNLEMFNLFDGLSDDDDMDNEEVETEQPDGQQESFCNETEKEHILKISNFDCWSVFGKVFDLTDIQASELKRRLQLTFFWLLETCALTIRVDWKEIYDELMVLETFFTHTIEPLENFKDQIIFQKYCNFKDINKIAHHFSSKW